MKKKLLLTIIFTVLVFSLFGEEAENAKLDNKAIKSETEEKSKSISKIEGELGKLKKEAEKEKDIRWRMCLDHYFAKVKALSAGADNAYGKVQDFVKVEKTKEALNQLILIRGLTSSAKKEYSKSQSCDRMLTSVDAKTNVIKEVNKDASGGDEGENVNDSMGLGFGSEFVADSDKKNVSGSGIADSAGVSSGDVNSESPGNVGEESESASEYAEHIGTPEVIDSSPTE
jgi:hypothetical protein